MFGCTVVSPTISVILFASLTASSVPTWRR